MANSHTPIEVIWALHDRTRGDIRPVPGWSITKVTPRVPIWGKSQHGGARVVHRILFQVTARELQRRPGLKPRVITFTVWRCRGKSSDFRGIQIMPDPVAARRPLRERCHLCERPDRSEIT